MKELGYVEGRNLVIEWRFGDGDYDRLVGMARDLAQLKVDVMLALGVPGAIAARNATTTVPVVFVVSGDPVKAGLVKSFARPGGNLTGISNLAGDLAPKQLELLMAAVPKLNRVALLVNPANAAHADTLASLQRTAATVGVAVVPVQARTEAEIGTAMASLPVARVGALIVALDPLFIQEQAAIAALALKHRLPSMFANSDAAGAGGLLSYGQNQSEIYQRAAGYVDRILRGASPGELPVEQPTKLELAINPSTARALGLTLPRALLSNADRLIE
jgi:putative ABC transport system substrate-binding protein